MVAAALGGQKCSISHESEFNRFFFVFLSRSLAVKLNFDPSNLYANSNPKTYFSLCLSPNFNFDEEIHGERVLKQPVFG